MLRALIALAFLEGCIPTTVVLIDRAMPLDDFIGALTNIHGFAQIVLPYISAADNSGSASRAHGD